MNALAIHLYLTIRHINLSFNYFGNFYRIIVMVFTSEMAIGVAAQSVFPLLAVLISDPGKAGHIVVTK